MPRGPKRERGFALPAVLWAMALLALLAAGFGSRARTELVIARNLIAAAEAEGIADGGIRLAALAIVLTPEAVVAGRPQDFAIGQGFARVTVTDEAGKLDLNVADLDLLRGLFKAVGLSPGTSQLLAAEIERRRAADPAAFASPAELGPLGQLDAATATRLAASLTVFTRSTGVERAIATPDVRVALGEFAPASSRPGPGGGRPAAPTLAPRAEAGRVFMLRSEGRSGGEAVFVREAVIALGARQDQPIRILSWRQGRVGRGGGQRG